jgi:hypothetical protein
MRLCRLFPCLMKLWEIFPESQLSPHPLLLLDRTLTVAYISTIKDVYHRFWMRNQTIAVLSANSSRSPPPASGLILSKSSFGRPALVFLELRTWTPVRKSCFQTWIGLRLFVTPCITTASIERTYHMSGAMMDSWRERTQAQPLH